MRGARFVARLFFACLLIATSLPPFVATDQAVAAEEAWKGEFEQVCGQTENFMNMSAEDLTRALDRCDRLKSQIERLEATPRKIYLKRLQMCRNLIAYMLESRGAASEK